MSTEKSAQKAGSIATLDGNAEKRPTLWSREASTERLEKNEKSKS